MGLRSSGPYLCEGKASALNSGDRGKQPGIGGNLVCGRMGKQLGHTGEFFRRRDEWRKHPMLTNQLRHATPGLGIALVAFGIYLVGEQVYNRMSKPSSSHHH